MFDTKLIYSQSFCSKRNLLYLIRQYLPHITVYLQRNTGVNILCLSTSDMGRIKTIIKIQRVRMLLLLVSPGSLGTPDTDVTAV